MGQKFSFNRNLLEGERDVDALRPPYHLHDVIEHEAEHEDAPNNHQLRGIVPSRVRVEEQSPEIELCSDEPKEAAHRHEWQAKNGFAC